MLPATSVRSALGSSTQLGSRHAYFFDFASGACTGWSTIDRVLVPGQKRRGWARWRRAATPDVTDIASALSFRMEYAQTAEELLGATAELLAARLRLSYVAFEIDHDGLGRILAASGSPVGEPVSLPLTYQGYPAGELVACGRGPGEAVGRPERDVLLSVARHAGSALHTARLASDLRQSMDRVLYAREDERRRLRHELHDSLGPILAGISLGLHAAQRIMETDTDQARQLVGHLEGELQSAIVEVRRLFETLRPPVLDQLGLVSAVREQIDILATRMRTDEEAPKDVAFTLDHDHDDDLGSIPAIVEVAAYRIVCEALTNVARHAHARNCTVTVRRARELSALLVEVADDGVGMGSTGGRPTRGLGLGSMRERAAELGGTFVVDSQPVGGTRVTATLPIQIDDRPRPSPGTHKDAVTR